jgi:hypothetical protein
MTSLQTTDFLNATSFIVVVERFKNIAFMTTDVSVPGITMSNPQQGNPFSNISRVGDRLQYDQITLSFKLNEDLSNWEEIVNWMKGAAYPEDYGQYATITEPSGNEDSLFTDITMTILSNYKKPLLNINYRRCLPTSLSGFQMTQTDSDILTVSCDVTFDFTTMDISRTL